MALDSILRYSQTKVSGDPRDTPLSVTFKIFPSSHPLALKTQSYIVFDGKCPCNTKKPYLVISLLQARLYGLWTSVTHPSALESLSKFTDLLTGMGNGFTGNGKLWTFAKISNPNETQVLMLSLGNNFVLLAPAKSKMSLLPFLQA